ncbi:hypothetical protein HY227_02975 [Candidatus Wolfebacteria bacterium]|nr:hypothetical protein [Candidatus Wolfebacteria bacterium]
MNAASKLTIAILISILAILSIYFGSYLPIQKSRIYIEAMRMAQARKIRNVQELNNVFDRVFGFYSPVGQDEIISGYVNLMLNTISQQNDRRVVDALIKEVEKNTDYLIKTKRKGFNVGQTIYSVGLLYKIEAAKFNDPVFYKKSEEILNEGLELSPNRAAFLYTLFELYLGGKDKGKVIETGEKILKYWPEDKEVEVIVGTLKSQK